MTWARKFPLGPLIIAAAIVYSGGLVALVTAFVCLLIGGIAGFVIAKQRQGEDEFIAQFCREPIWSHAPPAAAPKRHRVLTCWDVLDVPPTATVEEINAAFKAKAKTEHPDAGGLTIGMARLNVAREKALAARGVK